MPAPGGPNDGLWLDDDGAAGWCLSSETAALDIVGAEFVRDVEPGEIVVLEPGQAPRSVRFAEPNPALCVFELIYFARPDSYMEGRNLYEVRRRMGEQLAIEHPVEADLVMPVPDTGAPAAAGYAEASGLPYREGMYRNRYAGRTFIQPSQGLRHRGVTIKLNPLREVVNGKRLIVVDDSIVRGTTTKRIVELLRKAGATEVHVRISAPPIFHPCFYGIDTSIETELIASTHTEEQIREFIGADSLGYLSIRGVLAALDLPYEQFCFACFDGNYPGTRAVRRQEPQVHARRARGRRWLTRRGGAYRAAGVDVAAGERAVELHARPRRVDAPARGGRRPRRVRRRVLHPAGLSRAAADRLDRRRRHQDGHRGGRRAATTPSASTSSRCAPTTSCAPARSRWRSSTTSRSGSLDPVAVAELVGGVAAGCREAGCALVGGETAEHPGLMEADAFDMAGTAIGVVERSRVIDGSAGRRRRDPGPRLVGHARQRVLAGPRARGAVGPRRSTSPIRRGCAGRWATPRPTRCLAAAPHEALATLGEVLLTPTRIYARAMLAMRAAVVAAGWDIHGLAHITGGGLPGNVPRALAEGLGARLDPGRWRMPSVMRLFGALGGLDDEELRATFNGGLGMVVVLPRAAVAGAIGALAGHRDRRARGRRSRRCRDLGGARYVEGALESVA